MTRFRALPQDACRTAPLDPFVALYDRRSGQTHLLVEPAPEILDVLGDAALTLDEIVARLGENFDLDDGVGAALAARLDELVAAGLVVAR